MVGTIGTEIQKDRTPPVFVPPRKRQTNKKLNGTQNYVDHIVSIQGRNKLSSPTSPIIENKLIKTAALLACKTNEVIVDVNHSESKFIVTTIINNDNNIIAASSVTKEMHLDNLITNNYEDRCNSVEDDLNNFENLSSLPSLSTPTTTTTKDSQNVTPTTTNCFYTTEENNLLDENVNNKSIININNNSISASLKLAGPSKKRVNICTDNKLAVVRNENNKQSSSSSSLSLSSTAIINYDEDLEAGEKTNMILNKSVITNDLVDHKNNDNNNQNTINNNRIETYLTMTGTIKRGRKKGQSVDLQLNISREELEKINAAALTTVGDVGGDGIKRKNLCCYCTPTIGMHIFLLSILCLPFVTIITSIYSFYIGTITWYNVFNYFNDEKTYLHKLLMSPLLILTYPIVIVLCTIGLGIYAGCIQISIQLNCWLNEIADIEKGFYGWLCSLLHLSDCSPYEVVILTDLNNTPNGGIGTHAHSSTEELSL